MTSNEQERAYVESSAPDQTIETDPVQAFLHKRSEHFRCFPASKPIFVKVGEQVLVFGTNILVNGY